MRNLFVGSLCLCLVFSFALAETKNKSDNGLQVMRLERDLLQQIEAIELQTGLYSMDLVKPYTALSRLYLRTLQTDDAEDALRHLQHIIHRNRGVLSLDQLEMVQMMFALEFARDNFLRADAQQEFMLRIHEQSLDSGDPRLIAALEDYAQWQTESFQFTQARDSLDRLKTMIRESAGPLDARLISVLYKEAKLKSLQGACCAYKVLRESVDLARQMDLSPDVMSGVLMDYGDALLRSRRYDEAIASYKEAKLLQPDTFDGEPILLAGFNTLMDSTKRNRTYKVGRNFFDNTRLRQIGRDEVIFEQESDPQYYSIPLAENQYNLKIVDPRLQARNRDRDHYRELIGEPISFDYKQILHLLPLRFSDADLLNQLEVTYRFSVNEFGRTEHIELAGSNAPVRLNRLIKRVISKSIFRPGLDQGVPTSSGDIMLRQTFQRYPRIQALTKSD